MNVVPANIDSQHCIKALKPVYATHAIHVKSSALHLYININIDLIKLYFDSIVVLCYCFIYWLHILYHSLKQAKF